MIHVSASTRQDRLRTLSESWGKLLDRLFDLQVEHKRLEDSGADASKTLREIEETQLRIRNVQVMMEQT